MLPIPNLIKKNCGLEKTVATADSRLLSDDNLIELQRNRYEFI